MTEQSHYPHHQRGGGGGTLAWGRAKEGPSGVGFAFINGEEKGVPPRVGVARMKVGSEPVEGSDRQYWFFKGKSASG